MWKVKVKVKMKGEDELWTAKVKNGDQCAPHPPHNQADNQVPCKQQFLLRLNKVISGWQGLQPSDEILHPIFIYICLTCCGVSWENIPFFKYSSYFVFVSFQEINPNFIFLLANNRHWEISFHCRRNQILIDCSRQSPFPSFAN